MRWMYTVDSVRKLEARCDVKASGNIRFTRKLLVFILAMAILVTAMPYSVNWRRDVYGS